MYGMTNPRRIRIAPIHRWVRLPQSDGTTREVQVRTLVGFGYWMRQQAAEDAANTAKTAPTSGAEDVR